MQHLSARAARLSWRAQRFSWIIFALAIASSCSRNETGRLAASSGGDLSAAPVTRVAPGQNTPTCANLPGAGGGPAVLTRAPYLQRVTANDAVVVWTSASGTSASVLIEIPDGKQHTIVSGAIDPNATFVTSTLRGLPGNGAQ